jgi:hypothetical protein
VTIFFVQVLPRSADTEVMTSHLAKSTVLLALLSFGCNPPSDGASTGSTPQANKKANAGTTTKSCMAVVNGSETQGLPAVGLIYQRKNGKTATCTGTFVSPNTMITAAHCFPFGSSTSYVAGSNFDLTDPDALAEVEQRAVRSLKAIVSPIKIYEGNGIASNESYKDLAVVIFPDGTAPATMPILSRAAQHNEPADLYGFGRSAIDDGGETIPGDDHSIKRHGRNRVVRRTDLKGMYPETLLLFGEASGNGTQGSLASHGDSGGPLVIEGSIAGIASTASLTDGVDELKTKSEAFTVYADLSSKFARQFFRDAEAEGAVFTYSEQSEDARKAAGNEIASACQ